MDYSLYRLDNLAFSLLPVFMLSYAKLTVSLPDLLSQCLICLFWVTVKTWQCNIFYSLERNSPPPFIILDCFT